jgi:hypothetical protein
MLLLGRVKIDHLFQTSTSQSLQSLSAFLTVEQNVSEMGLIENKVSKPLLDSVRHCLHQAMVMEVKILEIFVEEKLANHAIAELLN